MTEEQSPYGLDVIAAKAEETRRQWFNVAHWFSTRAAYDHEAAVMQMLAENIASAAGRLIERIEHTKKEQT